MDLGTFLLSRLNNMERLGILVIGNSAMKSGASMQRNNHIDLLRIAACFAVIVIHVSGSNQDNVSINSAAWQIFNIFNSLARFSVPCFVMISGVFLLSPERTVTLKKLYLSKIRKTAVIWLIWELFYAVVDFIWRKETFSPAAFLQIGQTALSGHYHLWYLPMLIGLYIATPVLRALTEKKDQKLCVYVLILLFLSGSLLPTLQLLGFTETINAITDKFQITLFGSYIGYYLVGYYLYTYPLAKGLKIAIFCLAILGALATVLYKNFYYLFVSSASDSGFDFISVPVVFMSIGVFIFFKEYVSKIALSGRSIKIIASISSCTLGMYLLHAFVLERLYNFGLTTLSFHPLLSVLVLSVAGFLISWLIVFILRKIPVVRKYLV